MPNNRLQHLNKSAAAPKRHSKEILETLAVQPGWIIADVGAGGGFYALAFAQAAGPQGKVFAVDTDTKGLDYIQRSAMEKELENVYTFITPEEQLNLPDEKFDLVFMRNMFHHLPDPNSYFTNLGSYLKEDGKAAIIDYKKNRGFSLSFSQIHRHYSDPAVIMGTMQQANLVRAQSYDFLPEQSFQVFVRP